MPSNHPLQEALHQAKARRQSLAASVRSAQLELDRGPASTSPSPAARHARQVLADALAALLAPAPQPRQLGAEAELSRLIASIDRAEERHPTTCEELLGLHK